MIGIYAIQNKINGKIYVGQSVDIQRRWRDEKRSKKVNIVFKRAIEKYGIESFIFYVLKECEPKDLNYWESFYIKLYHTFDQNFGYNLTTGGDGGFGKVYRALSEEHKQKIRESHIGKYWVTPEGQKAGLEKRRLQTLERHKKDIYCLETNTIYHSYEELCEALNLNISCVYKCLRGVGNRVTKGYHICFAELKDTIEWNLHPYKNNGGTKNWHEGTIEKLRQSKMGHTVSKETREKLRIANLGKKLTDEHKRKISETQTGMRRKPGAGKNISEAKLKSNREKATRLIFCVDTDECFYSIQEAVDNLKPRYPKLCTKGVTNNLKGKNEQTQGLHFVYKPIEK